MPRPVTLFTGQWADLPLEDLARKGREFGYQGLELACRAAAPVVADWFEHIKQRTVPGRGSHLGNLRLKVNVLELADL